MSTADAALAVNILDPHSLLSSFGPIGVAVVLFAETGLLVGFLLPVAAAAGPRAGRGVSARYGYPRAIVLARFIPVVRTVLNPLAGIVGVPGRSFALWQILGGVLWSVGVTLAGYWLGSSIHNVDRYLLPIIALVVIVSLVPIMVEIARSRRGETGAA